MTAVENQVSSSIFLTIILLLLSLVLVYYVMGRYFNSLSRKLRTLGSRIERLDGLDFDRESLIEVKGDVLDVVSSLNSVMSKLHVKNGTVSKEVAKLTILLSNFESKTSITASDLRDFIKDLKSITHTLTVLCLREGE